MPPFSQSPSSCCEVAAVSRKLRQPRVSQAQKRLKQPVDQPRALVWKPLEVPLPRVKLRREPAAKKSRLRPALPRWWA